MDVTAYAQTIATVVNSVLVQPFLREVSGHALMKGACQIDGTPIGDYANATMYEWDVARMQSSISHTPILRRALAGVAYGALLARTALDESLAAENMHGVNTQPLETAFEEVTIASVHRLLLTMSSVSPDCPLMVTAENTREFLETGIRQQMLDNPRYMALRLDIDTRRESLNSSTTQTMWSRLASFFTQK